MRRARLISTKRILAAPWFHKTVGVLGAAYLRLVWKTSRFTIEPPDLYDWIDTKLPVIVATWHGQHIMVPFVRRDHHRAKVLISRHRDGEINAIVVQRLGAGTIRGSGTHNEDFHRKGGVPAFIAMLKALNDSWNIVLTADVPKVARVAGRGIIKLARESGRPIYPVAVTTRSRIQLNNWDRSTISLPFTRGAIVVGEPVSVPPDADDEAMELARVRLEAVLESITSRAYAIVDSRSGEVTRG